MAGKVDDDAGNVALGVAGRQHTDIRVNGPGRADDLIVMGCARFAGVSDFPAIAHEKAAVEGNAILPADTDTNFPGLSIVPCGHHRGRDTVREAGQVGGIAPAAVGWTDRAAGMRVAGANQDVLGGDASLLMDRLPGFFDGRPADEKRVGPDERYGCGATVDDAGDRPALVPHTFARGREEAAWDAHAR